RDATHASEGGREGARGGEVLTASAAHGAARSSCTCRLPIGRASPTVEGVKSLLIVLLLLLPMLAGAQSKFFRSADEARRAADGVATLAARGEPAAALGGSRQFSSIPGREFSAVEGQIAADV